MREFTYVIKNQIGIHARPAGMLVKEAQKYTSSITIEKNGKTANVKSIFNLLGMAVKQNDSVTLRAEGDDETEAISALKAFFEANL
jgi:phosphocarrier protein HPr